jgi:hypothetical protein
MKATLNNTGNIILKTSAKLNKIPNIVSIKLLILIISILLFLIIRLYYLSHPLCAPPLASSVRLPFGEAQREHFLFFSPASCSYFYYYNKNNNKNEARAKEIKKNKNATFAPPLACKGSIFVFLTRASCSASKRQFLLILIKIIIKTRHEQRLKKQKMLPLQARGGARGGGAKEAFCFFLLPLACKGSMPLRGNFY